MQKMKQTDRQSTPMTSAVLAEEEGKREQEAEVEKDEVKGLKVWEWWQYEGKWKAKGR